MTSNPQDWPSDFGYENGNYTNVCVDCKTEFRGHKRRVVCRACAYSVPLAELFKGKLKPHQISFLERLAEMERTRPEGATIRYCCWSRNPGWFAIQDGKIKFKWTGMKWKKLT